MTIAELKEKIKDFPDDMQVFIPSNETEYDCVLAEHVSIKNITFHHPDGNDEDMDVVKFDEY